MSPTASQTLAQPLRRIPQSVDAATVPDALLTVETVRTITGLSTSTLYRKQAAGQFPEPVRMGRRCTRWRAADVTAWLREQTPGGAQ